MIIIYHNNLKVVSVKKEDDQVVVFNATLTIAEVLSVLAQEFKSEKLVWCHIDLSTTLNREQLETLFHHNKLMLSYRSGDSNFFGDVLGYVEGFLFINVNKKSSFPTWQMSSAVGIIHASVLIEVKDSIPFNANLDYYLCSLAKKCMPLGLLCYSEPKLLKHTEKIILPLANTVLVFGFIKQHYKTRWLFILLFNLLVYERKFPFIAFVKSLFFKKKSNVTIDLDSIAVQSSRKVVDKGTVDVIIPTIGRKKHLYDVLCDLKKQTHLPNRIIIVEQNPLPNSLSELDYLQTEFWPFEVSHIFTHQAGACNARNLALKRVQSEWVFFADDDILFDSKVIQESLEKLKIFGAKAVSLRCFQKGQNKEKETIFQWGGFGSGCSFVASDILKDCEFKMGYEFGFGEDGDFGMQLRNNGNDVLYLPQPEILHLKAPMGGFRTKPELRWQNDTVQPKPSPTVMLYQIKHNTKEQISGYKMILFLKYYKRQKIKNPFKYYINFQKQWERSVFWANKLNNKK